MCCCTTPRTAVQGPACRDLIEVEAESVAYLVAAHHGLDTADYTFAYIAGWAGRDNEAITSTARRVLDTARTLIAATDPATTRDPTVAAELAATAQAQSDRRAGDRDGRGRDPPPAGRRPRPGQRPAAGAPARRADLVPGPSRAGRVHRGGHRPRVHPRRSPRVRGRVRPGIVDRAGRPPAHPRAHRHRPAGRRGRGHRPPRSADRPVPGPDHLPDPRPDSVSSGSPPGTPPGTPTPPSTSTPRPAPCTTSPGCCSAPSTCPPAATTRRPSPPSC